VDQLQQKAKLRYTLSEAIRFSEKRLFEFYLVCYIVMNGGQFAMMAGVFLKHNLFANS
jgi:hypothetical protein